MIILLLLTLPLLLAAVSYLLHRERAAKILLLGGGAVHLLLSVLLIHFTEPLCITESIVFKADTFGIVVLLLTSILFLFTSLYMNSWMPVEAALHGGRSGMKRSTFTALMLLFLFSMTLTALAQDFGMLWVAVEATTLASAPLINYRKSKTSLEAMWKYLLICSLGIGLALFGTMLIAASLSDQEAGISFAALNELTASGQFDTAWFKAGFVLCFAGYALKMGLAPFHTWLPDAYSEAVSPISALLSGALINCSMLAVYRLWQIVPSELQGFCGGYLKFFGFLSLAVAAFFIISQKDFKRMLAYSSVEHMGLISLLLVYDLSDCAAFHITAHSLLKMALFLTAGNIILSYRTRSVAQVKGIFDRLPVSGSLWILGMLLLCGTPPSPLFFTELALVREAGIIPGAAVLLLLVVIFCAMSQRMLQMAAPAAVEKDVASDKLAKIPAAAIFIVAAAGFAAVLAQLWER